MSHSNNLRAHILRTDEVDYTALNNTLYGACRVSTLVLDTNGSLVAHLPQGRFSPDATAKLRYIELLPDLFLLAPIRPHVDAFGILAQKDWWRIASRLREVAAPAGGEGW